MAQQTRVVKVLTVAIGIVSVIGTIMKFGDVPARIVYFRAVNGTYSVPQGSHILLQWRAQGLGSKAWLDGQPVNLEDTKDVLITSTHTYNLVTRGFFGEDSIPVSIEIQPVRQSSEAAATTTVPTKSTPPEDTSDDSSVRKSSSTDAPPDVSPPRSQVDPPRVAGDGEEPSAQRGAIPVPAREVNPPTVTVQAGFLSVRTDPADSSLDIVPLGHAKTGTLDVSCPPGSYTITARHSLLVTDTRAVIVQPGQRLAVEIHLLPDAASIHEQLDDAAARVMGGDAVSGFRTASAVVAVDPDNQQARSLLAQTYFRTGQIGSFYTAGLQALQHHAPVPVELIYRDKQFHRTVLLIEPKALMFSTGDSNASNVPHHPVQFGDIKSVEVIHNSAGEVYLQVKFEDLAAQRKQTEIRLFVNGVHTEKRQVLHAVFIVDQTVVISPPNASQVLDTVANIIHDAMSRKE